jgi:hypothetical protein
MLSLMSNKIRMSEEKSAIDLFNDYARKTGRELIYKEQPYPSTAMQRITYHRRTLYLNDRTADNICFACFADSREFGKYALFSGIFMPVDLPLTCHISIRNKDILDKLNPFNKKKLLKTGIPAYDAKTVITGNDPLAVKKIYQERRIQQLTDLALPLDPGIVIAINEAGIDFIPSFKDKPHLGIFTTTEWITDNSLIDKLYTIAERFMIIHN